jgi:hypothetical protein
VPLASQVLGQVTNKQTNVNEILVFIF